MRRLAAMCVFAVLAALAASAGSSAAATHRQLPALKRLASRLQPHGTASSQGFLELRFAPTTVAVDDVDYTMRLDVIRFGSGTFAFSQIDLDLVRLGTASLQDHDYGFTPEQPVAFATKPRTLARATLNTGNAIAPNVLQGSFTATRPLARHACTLAGGRTGYRLSRRGTVAWNQFSIDTGTAPFFGVLTNGPLHARLFRDPGCHLGGRHHRRRHHPPACGARRSIETAFARPTEFVIESDFAGTRTFQAAASASLASIESVFHVWVGLAPGADLPPVHHSATGATAHFLTTGAPFLTGSATFTSTRPPHVGRLRRCIHRRHVRRFRPLRYHGHLQADPSPLTAPFDTGDVVLNRLPATLLLRRYR